MNQIKFCLVTLVLLRCGSGTHSQTSQAPVINSTSIPSDVIRNGTCLYAPGLTVGDEPRRLECCNDAIKNYQIDWSLGRTYLTAYLQSLQSWKCPQFEEQCEARVYVFNEFTGLVYDYFCNNSHFIEQCYDTINTVTVTNNRGQNDSDWSVLINELNPNTLSLEELGIPCVQVALYESEEEHFGDYHEVIRLDLPSCEPVWCGYHGDTLRSQFITMWMCMTNSCRAKMIVIMIVCAILAIIISIVNLSVILVYFFNRSLLHSQGVYKVSLAFADILVGIIVFPTFISSLNRIVSRRQKHAELVDVIGYNVTINGSLSDNQTIVQVRSPGGQFSDFFDQPYLNAVGFFTLLSLSVSIYNLTVAGFDRLAAVYRPLSYRKDKAKSLAKKLCFGLWGIGILFALLPTFVPGLNYAVIASILISSGGTNALILYMVAFAIPLVLMWTVNAATLQSTKKHARVRRHLTIDSKKKTTSIEVRLARTLAIMVGVFTLSILPAAIVILASLFARSIYFTEPRELDLQSAIVYGTFEFASIVILACNSLWNFFIYSARNLEFRKAVQVLFHNASERIGLTKCCIAFQSCARSVVHDSRRRISSIPNISTTFTKKSSLVPTGATTLTSKTNSSTFSSTNETSQSKTSRGLSTNASSTNIRSSDFESSRLDSSNDVSVTSLSASSKKDEKKRHRSKQQEDKMVTDDSVFQSFAIDANADRLCLSVMEQIDEEIVDA